MSGDAAKNMYTELLTELKTHHNHEKIKDGRFGAIMEVNIANDGPVTIELEAKNENPEREYSQKAS